MNDKTGWNNFLTLFILNEMWRQSQNVYLHERFFYDMAIKCFLLLTDFFFSMTSDIGLSSALALVLTRQKTYQFFSNEVAVNPMVRYFHSHRVY